MPSHRLALPLVVLLSGAHGLAHAGGAVSGGPAGAGPVSRAPVSASARAAPDSLPPAPPPPGARAVVPSSGGVVRPRALPTEANTGLPVEDTRLSVRALYQPDTRIGAGLGDYSVERIAADLRVKHNLSSCFQLAGDLALERGTFDFTDPAALVPTGTGDLGGSMTGVRVGLGGSWSLSRGFGLTLAGTARWLWMDGADLGDSFQPGVVAAVRVRLFGKTDLFVGASYTQGLENDTYIHPMLGLGGLSTAEQSRWHMEARGTGFAVAYDLTSRLSLGAVAAYERRDVRLAPDDRLPDGVLRERRLPIGLELGWRLRGDSFLLLSGGASIWNRLTLLDSNGNTVLDENTDLAPYAQLEWSARF